MATLAEEQRTEKMADMGKTADTADKESAGCAAQTAYAQTSPIDTTELVIVATQRRPSRTSSPPPG